MALIGDILEIFDRLASLSKEPKRQQFLILKEEVEPLFSRMKTIHMDFLEGLHYIKWQLAKDLDLEKTKKLVETLRLRNQPFRKTIFSEVILGREELRNHRKNFFDTNTDKELEDFYSDCIQYFIINGEYNHAYSSVLKKLYNYQVKPYEHSIYSDKSGFNSDLEHLKSEVSQSLLEIDLRWTTITRSYARIRWALRRHPPP